MATTLLASPAECNSVEELVGLLRCERLGMLTCYVDESGVHANSRICAMAAFVGGERDWRTVETRWRQALKDSGVGAFHMADFENRKGEFENWSDQHRKGFLQRLLKIICSRELRGFGSAVVIEDYEKLSLEDKQKISPRYPEKPYFLCFQHCVWSIAGLLADLPEDERVAFVFDRQSEFASEAMRLYAWLKDEIRWDNQSRLADRLGFASHKETIPIQVADLAAYETYKLIENAHYAPGRPVRWPFRQLEKAGFQGRFYGAKDLRLLADGLEARL